MRRLGFVFIGATMLINIFAVVLPAKNTYAGSAGNIMVGGGGSDKAEILSKYDADPWVQAVYSEFGISRADIEKMVPDEVDIAAAKGPGWNQNLVTAGRMANNKDDSAFAETPVNIAGATIYKHTVDSAFDAPTVKVIWCSKEVCGRYKAIALVCGNPIIDMNEEQVHQTPQPMGFVDGITCERMFGWAYNDMYSRFVHIYVDKPLTANSVEGKDYFEVQATQDTRPDVKEAFASRGVPSSVGWSWDGGPLVNDGKDHKLWAYVTDRGAHFAALAGGEGVAANFTCQKPVIKICPAGPLVGKPAPDDNLRNCPESPIASCTKLTALSRVVQINTDARFSATAVALNGAKVNGYKMDFGDGSDKTFGADQSDQIVHKYTKLGTWKAVLTVQSSEGDKTSPDCAADIEVKAQPVPCTHDSSILLSDTEKCTPCPENPTISIKNTTLCVVQIVQAKKVANITKGTADANNTTASPGDILEYTLLTTNTGTKLSFDQTTSESIADILDYAVTDNLGTAKLAATTLSWPKTTIVAGDTIKQVFRVKIKDTIPATPPSISDAGTFDLTMVNTYGNATSVKVPCPPTLCVQNVATKLPQTGPGSTMLVTFMIVCMIGFFYNRNRILAKELDFVKADYQRGA
jgi:hypothetical protein